MGGKQLDRIHRHGVDGDQSVSVGSRKGESAKLPGDVDTNDWFTRASVTYRINMRAVVDPTESELHSMREGDLARLAPKGAKCDSFGTCHGTEPIVLPFSTTRS